MKRYTFNQIENRISKAEEVSGRSQVGKKYVGRYYDELTDEEKEEYLDYIYGKERGFNHETLEKMLKAIHKNDSEKYLERIHSPCKIRERDPDKKVSPEEIRKSMEYIKRYLREERGLNV